MNKSIVIGGSPGKAGGQARVPIEVPDSLRSKSFAQVVDLLGEGEFEGFVDEDGRLLLDAQVESVTVVDGKITGVSLLPGSSGYPVGPTRLVVIDETGTDAILSLYADPDTGEALEIDVENQGTGYSDSPIVVVPPVVGKAVMLDGSPLQNSDLSFNYEDVHIAVRTGTQHQTPIPGFAVSQKILYASEGEVTHGNDVVFQIDDPATDILIVGIRVPEFYKLVSTTGDILGTQVIYSVYLTYNPPGVAPQEVFLYRDTIEGKSGSDYVRTIRTDISFTKHEGRDDHRWLLRVKRETATISDSTLRNRTFLSFVTGISNTPLSYPNSALIAIEVNAEQFRRIPVRGYRVKMTRVKVPSNYFPLTRTYNRDKLTGQPVVDANSVPVDQIWDGTFYTAWTNNPAWCFYDLVTSERYGLGQHIPAAQVDKWFLYKIGRYCDVLVPDGFGGYEPRFACTLYLQAKERAYTVLQDFVSIFRGMLYFNAGLLVPIQDAPEEHINDHFTNSNVVDGMFTYAGTGRQTRHTVAYVRYNDPDDSYRPKQEYVENLESIIRYGYRDVSVSAFGCTSRGQAHRVGEWLLFTERYETETISFRTGMQGVATRPGHIVAISDNDRSGVLFGGRIMRISDDRTQVFTDKKRADFDLLITNYTSIRELGDTPISFDVLLQSPATVKTTEEISTSAEVEESRVPQITKLRIQQFETSEEGNLVLKLANSLVPETTEPGFVWGISSSIIEPQQARVLSRTDEPNGEFSFTAVEHDPRKYDAIENGLQLEPLPISTLPDTFAYPQTPRNLTLSFSKTLNGALAVYRITAIWDSPRSSYVNEYEIYVKKGQGNYHFRTATSATSVDIEVNLVDTYSFKVYAVGMAGRRSVPAQASIFVNPDYGSGEDNEDPEAPPILGEQITGLELFNQANETTFRGKDAIFDWRINSLTNSYEFGSEPSGGNSGGNSLSFEHYQITVFSPRHLNSFGNELVLRQFTTKESGYAFRFEENRETPFGPHRDILFQVIAKTTDNKVSAPAVLRVSNPHPTVPAGVVVDESQAGKLVFQFPASGNSDFAGWRVWLSQTADFDPKTVRPVYEGTANPLTLIVTTGEVYYYRYAEYDVFSDWIEYANFTEDELNAVVSAQETFTAA